MERMANISAHNIYIDPYLFICPKRGSSQYDVEQYARSLLFWRDLCEVEGVSVHHTYRTSTILAKLYGDPPYLKITDIIAATGQNTIPADAIRKVLLAFLSERPALEDALGLSDVLVTNFEFRPDSHLQLRSTSLREDYARFLTLICLARDIQNLSSEQQLLSTSGLDIQSSPATIEFSSTIADYEWLSSANCQTLPTSTTGSILATNGVHGVKMDMDPTRIWKYASTMDSYQNALTLCLYQTAHHSSPPIPLTRIQEWSFGHQFFQLAEAHGFLREESKIKMLIDACSDTIMKRNMSRTHKLRVNNVGGSPARKRGDSEAWRRDVDRTYHLHYWQSNKGLEFASVVVHNDMTIPE